MAETVHLRHVRRPARRRRGAVLLGVVGLLAAATVAAGGGAAAAPAAAPASCSDTTGTPYATGLAPLPCLPSPSGVTRWSDNGQLLVPHGPLNLFVGDRRLARMFTLVCGNGGAGFATCPAAVAGPQPPASTPAITAVEQIFIQSRAGYPTQYGELARVPVDQPTSAGRVRGTLVLAQAATDGVVRPVVARESTANSFYPAGTTVAGFEQYGPNPGPGRAQVFGDVAGSGPATVTLTGVTLDGVAVDTGSCQATGPLRVSARGGWATGAAVQGGPAEYRPFAPPSFLHAALGRLATSGCDDLDPAVTAVLQQNVAFLQQVTIDFTAASGLTPYGCLASPTASNCLSRHPATVNPARVPAVL